MPPSYLKANISFNPQDEGGRISMPVGSGFAPYLRSSVFSNDLAVRINGMPVSGKYATDYEVEVELSYHPKVDYSLLEIGTRFEVIEGRKVVGKGNVLSAIYQR